MQLHNELEIKRWEVYRNPKTGLYDPNLEAYMPTPNDVPTIGWGHTKGVKMGDVITHDQAQAFFESDVAWVVAAVNKHVTVGLTQNQFDALCAFVFNIGEGAFKNSTLLRKLNAGDYQGAAEQLPRWNKQKGKVLKGLARRRASEMALFLSAEEMEETTPAKGEVDAVEGLKPLLKSKEMVAGAGALLAGGAGVLGALTPVAQTVLITGVVAALLGFGAFIVWNRVRASNRAER